MTTVTTTAEVRQSGVDGGMKPMPRKGSRLDRMMQPVMREVLTTIAESEGVCIRPIAIRRIDKLTGETTVLDVPCGARLAVKCKPCANRQRRLRVRQFTEGWHLTDEPTPPVEIPASEVRAAVELRCTFAFDREQSLRESDWAQVKELDEAIEDLDTAMEKMRVRGSLPHPAAEKKPRQTRSTARRKDVAEIPRLPVSDRTVGKIYRAPDGKTYQPSMFLTMTLDSYGKVHSGPRMRRGQLAPCECGTLHGQQDGLLGTPLDGEDYDYRRAALDAIHFAKVLDRFWQNLRRSAGWKVQYAGSIEMQKRLAPHAHYAMRGTLPRKLIADVAAATYHHVWWPSFDKPTYTLTKYPTWDEELSAYVDPKTGQALTPWATAVTGLKDSGAEPAHVARLGKPDAKGINPGTQDADRSIRYATKYLTKDLLEQVKPRSDAQKAHHERLTEELATLPCSPTCANWLLYAVQPDKAKKGLVPGRCSGKVHQRNTLGFTGRRVLVSRQWSGKTLADHRADQRAWVRTVLSGAYADEEMPEVDENRFAYQLARPDEPDVPKLEVRLMNAIEARRRHKLALQALAPPGAVPATQINNVKGGQE